MAAPTDNADAVSTDAAPGSGASGPAALLTDRLRRSLGSTLRAALGAPEPEARPHVRRPGDPGLFGPDSVTWRVHADTSMIVAGLRALLLQTLHPLAMAGVAEHSDYRNDPWGRLQRTGQFVGATTYGGTDEAERAIETVVRVHRRVRGVAPNGLPYRASDPHLITWVHATEVDSFLRTYQRYGRAPLGERDADRYVQEMAVIGNRLGGSDVPTSRAELRVWLRAVRPELRAGAQARDGVRFLLAPPLPLLGRAPYGVVAAAAVGLLPPFARRMLHLPVPPGVEALAVRPAARGVLAAMGWALGPPPERETPTATGAPDHDGRRGAAA